ncbi:amidohydrolase [Novosphingobium sp. PC22D]|uniref:amidohydrolase family protein n=1 Tax=Novosphingobium sp. PC22D TaxID=1962403 RepID=UPI000BF195D7|nr:amidohydrolase family protein [Novosphingobium sp. PC22D]PEQ11145.1 amidohydrolase [Novosphingobium sp. PC22D]
MRSLIFAAAASLAALSAPALAETTEYRVLMGDRDIGHFTVTREGEDASVVYDYKQNGRGPTIAETLKLDPQGAPLDWKITGRTTFGNAVEETFRRTARGVDWQDTTGPGTIMGTDAPRYYASQNGSPMDLALLAKALLADADHTFEIAPGGTATLTERDRRSVEGEGGPREIVTYELSGLSLSPTYITLDGEGNLFALPSPGFDIILAGYESADEELRNLSEKLEADHLARLQAEGAHRYGGPVRVRNVRVFDPVKLAMSEPMDVVFAGERISEVLPAGSQATEGETIVDGVGGSLVPGLYEMHGHLGPQAAMLNVLAGVTSLRDMGNDNEALAKLIERIDAGEVAGPRVTRSGFIEGKSEFSAAHGRLAHSEQEAIEHVRWYAARGFWQAKLYNSMNPDWAPAVVSEAHRLGLRVAGHVPAFSSADAMIEAGFDEITHVNQLMLGWVLNPGEDTRTLFRFKAMQRFPELDLDSPKVRHTLDMMVARGSAHEPTVAIHELGLTALDGKPNPGSIDYIDHMPVSEQRQMKQALFGTDSAEERAAYVAAYAKILDTLREMHKRGILLIPGTDLGGAFNLHRELEIFTQIGMTPAEVLARDTLEMAKYLGEDQSLGSIEPGKYADFFLVPGDPVKDIKAIKTIAMVVKGGLVYFPTETYRKIGIAPFVDPPKVTAPKIIAPN